MKMKRMGWDNKMEERSVAFTFMLPLVSMAPCSTKVIKKMGKSTWHFLCMGIQATV